MAGHRADTLAALVRDAMKVPPGQRREWIRQACGGDAALAARVRDALPTEPGDVPVRSPLLKPLESVPDVIRRVGPYTLRGVLGEGTFGVVYLADQSEPIPRRVALKVLKTRGAAAGRDVIERFARERRLLARLDHPGIAHVLDAGVTDDGRPWFALEFVRGLPLLRHCDEARLPIESRIRLFEEVCRAVHHAHQNGVLHRDLKPANILVSPGQPGDGTPPWGLPKVIDFGIAEALGGDAEGEVGDASGDVSLGGRGGAIVGTLEYMSPEQATGLDLDPRSDVYSLGAILHHLLTGRPPLERGEAEAHRAHGDRDERAAHDASAAPPGAGAARSPGDRPPPQGDEVLAFVERVRSEDPPAPSAVIESLPPARAAEVARLRSTAPASLVRALRGDLDWIVARCLAKDRAQRYDSAADLAADLRRHLASYPVEAAPANALYRLGRFVRRHRRATAAVLVSALSLVVAVAAVGLSLRVALAARDAERVARQEAERANAEASDALSALVTLITRISLDKVARGASATPDEILTAARQELLEPFRERPRAQAEVRIAIAKALLSLDHPRAAEREISAATALLGTLGPAGEPGLIDALRTSASIDEHLGHYDAAEEKLDRAFALQQGSDPDSPIDWTELWIDRARVAISRGDGVGARRAVAEAVRQIRRIDDPALREQLDSNAAFFRAEALLLDRRWHEALDAIRPNVVFNEASMPGHWWVAESSAVEAAALIGMGEVERGRRILALAEPQLRKALPPGSPPRRVIGRLLAAAFDAQGLHEEAQRWRNLPASP